ncbi:hypothetical protein RRG08_003709, partial [Elysia crispata]
NVVRFNSSNCRSHLEYANPQLHRNTLCREKSFVGALGLYVISVPGKEVPLLRAIAFKSCFGILLVF